LDGCGRTFVSIELKNGKHVVLNCCEELVLHLIFAHVMERKPVVSCTYEGPNGSQTFSSQGEEGGLDGVLSGLKQVQKQINVHLYTVAGLPVPPGGEEESSDDEIRFDKSSSEEEGMQHYSLRSNNVDSESGEGAPKKPRLAP
jgi:hypothetical protein